LNAFRAYQAAGFDSVQRFATVGTGSGTDVLAALDTFPKLASVALTDLHAEVVKVAKLNVLSATKGAKKSVRTTAEQTVARAGDLLWPLKGEKQFDLIYESV
jgi:methylase of polypeptide subunit release factors